VYDVIVVGARCAGAATALLFARAGYRVLMLDRARFPADTLSTLYIHQPGVARLSAWNLLERVVLTGCPSLDSVLVRDGDVCVAGSSWPIDGMRTAYAPRRYLLDQILAEAAVDAGVEFRDGCRVDELLFDHDRVVGVRCRTPTGRSAPEYATLVVGADGMRSRVARQVRAPHLIEDAPMTCAYFTFWPWTSHELELYEAPGSLVGVIPTNDGASIVGVYFPQREFPWIRADALPRYLERIRTVAPVVHDRIAGSEQLERLYGTGHQLNFFRQAAGPGWALVGDAAHHKDSITARGITDAFLQAEMLVTAVGAGLHDEGLLHDALDRYATESMQLLIDTYQSTLSAGLLDAGEDRRALLRAVASSPDLVERYFAAVAGDCTIEELYTPELVDLLDA